MHVGIVSHEDDHIERVIFVSFKENDADIIACGMRVSEYGDSHQKCPPCRNKAYISYIEATGHMPSERTEPSLVECMVAAYLYFIASFNTPIEQVHLSWCPPDSADDSYVFYSPVRTKEERTQNLIKLYREDIPELSNFPCEQFKLDLPQFPIFEDDTNFNELKERADELFSTCGFYRIPNKATSQHFFYNRQEDESSKPFLLIEGRSPNTPGLRRADLLKPCFSFESLDKAKESSKQILSHFSS